MERLPIVDPDPPPSAPEPQDEEIFKKPESPTPASPPETPAKPARRKYTRDPENLKAHMKLMRDKAAEARARKKEAAAAKVPPPPPPTTHTAIAPHKEQIASFEKFMEYYSKAESYKSQLAASKQQAEDAAMFRVTERKRLRKRKKKEPKSHPFGIEIAPSPEDAYSRYFK